MFVCVCVCVCVCLWSGVTAAAKGYSRCVFNLLASQLVTSSSYEDKELVRCVCVCVEASLRCQAEFHQRCEYFPDGR